MGSWLAVSPSSLTQTGHPQLSRPLAFLPSLFTSACAPGSAIKQVTFCSAGGKPVDSIKAQPALNGCSAPSCSQGGSGELGVPRTLPTRVCCPGGTGRAGTEPRCAPAWPRDPAPPLPAASRQHAEGAGSALPAAALAQHTEGTAQCTEGRFCSVSKGQPRTSARSNVQGAARRQLKHQPDCSPAVKPCLPSLPSQGQEGSEGCSSTSCPRRAPPSSPLAARAAPGLCSTACPGEELAPFSPAALAARKKRAAISKEQVRELRVLPCCAINHEKFFLLSCMKRNLAGRSDHRDVLLARQQEPGHIWPRNNLSASPCARAGRCWQGNPASRALSAVTAHRASSAPRRACLRPGDSEHRAGRGHGALGRCPALPEPHGPSVPPPCPVPPSRPCRSLSRLCAGAERAQASPAAFQLFVIGKRGKYGFRQLLFFPPDWLQTC